jgi:hypothetical protein
VQLDKLMKDNQRMRRWLLEPILEALEEAEERITFYISLTSISTAINRRGLTTFRVTEPVTGLSIEGVDLIMNLKNTEQVSLEVKAKNRKGGPATGVSGTFSAITDTSCFTVETDAGNPLKALCKGNPNAAGDSNDIGLVRFDGQRTASDGSTQPVTAEIAINILAADAETIEMTAGTPEEQA